MAGKLLIFLYLFMSIKATTSYECLRFDEGCGFSCLEQVSSWEILELTSNLPRCSTFTLYLSNGRYHSFPERFFDRLGHVNSIMLEITNVTFTYFPSSKETKFKNVIFDTSTYIQLSEVRSREWNWELFSYLVPRKGESGSFNCYSCDLTHLSQDFSRVQNGSLDEIRFSDGNLKTLDDGVFASFLILETIYLHGNEIEEMKRNYFPVPAQLLETIILKGNKIRHLPLNMFFAMPSLGTVDLSENLLTVISETVFRRIIHLDFLYLSGLPLHCDCKLRWILFAMEDNKSLRYMDITCATPAKLRGLQLETLTKEQLEC